MNFRSQNYSLVEQSILPLIFGGKANKHLGKGFRKTSEKGICQEGIQRGQKKKWKTEEGKDYGQAGEGIKE